MTGIEALTIRSDRLVTQQSGSYNSPNRSAIRSDGEAELMVSGGEGILTVKVPPDSVEEVKGRAQAFLQDPGQHQMRFFTIANRKFGLGFGLPCTLLAALYLVGSTVAIMRKLLSAVKR